jgi:hypothetical protein
MGSLIEHIVMGHLRLMYMQRVPSRHATTSTDRDTIVPGVKFE